MRTRAAATSVLCLVSALYAAPVQAQYAVGGASDRATGERYHVELAGTLWNPTPTVSIKSEALGIIGDTIDFVDDLGIEKSRFRQIRAVLRPGTKHKFRFEYTPIKYEAESVLSRNIVFNGITFPVSVPVASELEWKAYRFGYEFDFIYRERGFLGLVLEAKYTDVGATLSSAIDTEFVRARAPIPAIGLIGRVYPVSNISITAEFSGIKVPESIDEDYRAKYFDFDIYGTINFHNNAGAQIGYRSFDVFYKIDDDEGELKLKGIYFGGVVRF